MVQPTLENPTRRVDSVRIVREVAKREDIPQSELQPTLFEVIDPDALDSLLADGPTEPEPLTIRFRYAGYDITARSDGTLDVD